MAEIDGVGHLEVNRWYDDLLRAAEVVRSDEQLIRLPSMAARLEPDRAWSRSCGGTYWRDARVRSVTR